MPRLNPTLLWLTLLLACPAMPGYAAAAGAHAAAPSLQDSNLHFTVNSKESDVRFLVYRTGLLAAFGHNHVVRATRITGDIIARPDDFSASGFQLIMPVADFRVDDATDRRREGRSFNEQPSPRAIAATRHNMLSAGVLDAAHYPNVMVHCVAIAGTPRHAVVTARIRLRNVQRNIRVPVSITVTGESLSASGHFDISQRMFNIKPYAALAGGLRVKDIIHVEFHIEATRVPGQ